MTLTMSREEEIEQLAREQRFDDIYPYKHWPRRHLAGGETHYLISLSAPIAAFDSGEMVVGDCLLGQSPWDDPTADAALASIDDAPADVEERPRRWVWAGDRTRRLVEQYGTCAYGHPWTPENSYYPPNGTSRRCRTCGRLRARKDYVAPVHPPRRRHGFPATYNAGCRCGECRKAATARRRAYRMRNAA